MSAQRTSQGGETYLHKERNERKVVEVQLHLVCQGIFACSSEGIWRAKLINDGEGRQDGVFLIDPDTIG